MHKFLKTPLKHIVANIPLSLYRFFIKMDLVTLCYHLVSDKSLPHITEYRYKTKSGFEDDIRYLKKNFNLISYDEFCRYKAGGSEIKKNALLLTFDDGLSECFWEVRPILLKHNVPCIFFITTDFIGSEHYLTREEIKFMAKDGFTIGAHSKRHIQIDLLPYNEAEEEITGSCRIIMELLGVNHLPFAFPYHGGSIDRNFLKDIISKHGYIDFFFDAHSLIKEEDFIINRIWVESPAFNVNAKYHLAKLLSFAYAGCLRHRRK
jgi:peptidoglycan/xylan/chitin deacetylase (PgdA/CDA1 family)